MGRKAGILEAQLMNLRDFENSAEFNDLEKLVLRYASAMTQTPVSVADDLFEDLRSHFNERQSVGKHPMNPSGEPARSAG